MNHVDALGQQSVYIFREAFRHFVRIKETSEIRNV